LILSNAFVCPSRLNMDHHICSNIWRLHLYFKRSEHFFRRRISPSFKNGIIRLEAGAFKFLRNRLFMTSMQLPPIKRVWRLWFTVKFNNLCAGI
jgi:hypothetical protein